MDDSFGLRPATDVDGNAIRSLVFAALTELGFRPDPTATDADLTSIEATYLRVGGLFDVLVNREQEVVGTVGLLPIGNGRCELRKMYLRPDYRGCGLGRKLLRHALDRARQLGFRRMELETHSALKAAIGLYESFGFTPFVSDHASATPDRADRSYCLKLVG